MKSVIAAFLCAYSLQALANVDTLLGTYRPKRGEGEATITKVQVTEATLFEPAKFEYRLELNHDKHDLYLNTALVVSADGKSLSGSDSNECDDPGCYYIDSADITVTQKSPRAKPVIKVEYSGNHYDDGDVGAFDFTGTVEFRKN